LRIQYNYCMGTTRSIEVDRQKYEIRGNEVKMSGGTTKWKKIQREINVPTCLSHSLHRQPTWTKPEMGGKGESSKTSVVNKAPHVPHLHDPRRARDPTGSQLPRLASRDEIGGNLNPPPFPSIRLSFTGDRECKSE